MEKTGKTKEMDMLNGGLAGKLILFSIPLACSSCSIPRMWRSSEDLRETGRSRQWEAALRWWAYL